MKIEIEEIVNAAAPVLAKLRRGEPLEKPKMVVVRVPRWTAVIGVCPVCGRKVHTKYGAPRTTAPVKAAPNGAFVWCLGAKEAA